jgi:[NiFe] hydrogenase diaphorase moiety small subunit
MRLTIDGIEVEAQEGDTVMTAAERGGIYIPHLCHRPGLTPHGSCRVCTVVVNGRRQSACTTPVTDGMVVDNATTELLELRRNLIDMLFVSGNHYCMFCEKSGDCELQALAYRFGITAPRYPFLFPSRSVDASHPDVLIDHNRCILCSRCARASRELDGKSEFGFLNRSSARHLGVNSRDGLSGTDIDAADEAVAACPVGAIIRKRTGFRTPVGERTYDSRPIGSDVDTSNELGVEES